ncbi:uncharacterized protein [Dendrobates tinctorius]|uniref:uncharacterized protein n=1 Tax=Dendrobates tinctorius TaxID=92724 RepID=UPI003CCA4B48
MDEDRNETTRRLFHCALEIISLLSGEDYTIVRKTPGDCVTPIIHLQESGGRSPGPITEPPPHSPIHERNKKILELSNKMIELLSGEVPIRCQDVAVYLSMEEWEYLEGHQDRYQAVMMEERRPLTPRDGSRRRNPPERCPRPLCPQDCPEENHNILEDHQGEDLINIKVEVIHGAQETIAIWADQQDGSRRRNPPERCPRPLYPHDCSEENRSIPEDHQGEDLTDIKVEVIHGAEEAIAIWADQQHGSRRRNPPERCPRPLYPQDCPEENHNIPEDHQEEDPTKNKVKDETEEVMTRGDQPYVSDINKEISVDVSTGNSYENNGLSLSCKEDIRKHSNGENLITLHEPPGLHSTSLSYTPPNHEEPSPEQSHIVTTIPGDKVDTRFQCDKQLTTSSDFLTQRKRKGEKPYSCSECGKCFTYKSQFVSHLRIHTGEKPFSCSECEKTFTEKGSLIRHQTLHTGEKPYSCSECGKCFAYKGNLIAHKKIHTGEKPYSCSECGKCFTTKSKCVKHERIHTGEKTFSCMECGTAFSYKGSLLKHQLIHTGETPYSCSECGRFFSSQSHLVTHLRIHTEERPVSCLECGKCFPDKSGLVTHERTHTGEKPYSCSLRSIGSPPPVYGLHCELHKINLDISFVLQKKFTFILSFILIGNSYENNGLSVSCKEDIRKHSNGENLITLHGPPGLHSTSLSYTPNPEEPSPEQSHIVTTIPGDNVDTRFQCDTQLTTSSDLLAQRKHKGKKTYSCSECGKCFNYKSHFVSHQRIHREYTKPFSCSECEKSFTDKGSLITHQRIHTGEKPYSCSECGKCFTEKRNLISHQIIHTGEKTFSCMECGTAFINKGNLLKHQLIHTGETPYSCSECGRFFISQPHLVKHLRIHTEERPVSCLECGKCLPDKSGLVKHERTHTGEKPYCCSECGKYFTNKSKFVIHERIHTGEKPYSCSECGKCFLNRSQLATHEMIHIGEKPYSCSECGKSFFNRSRLAIHERCHTGEKPYSCSECGKCFIHKSNHVKHERRHAEKKL